MSVIFQDLQDKHNALNGTRVGDGPSLHVLLDAMRQREPFLFELNADGGDTLTVGLASDVGCVQHTGSEGSPPYLMAVNEVVADDDQEFVEFLAGGTPTPMPKKYCLPVNAVEAIAAEFVASGNRSAAVAWEEV
jgi:hypothetical protein